MGKAARKSVVQREVEQAGMDVPAELLEDFHLTGFEDAPTRQILLSNHLLRKARMASLVPLLPMLLNIKGTPYSLEDYFPFETFFRTRLPRKTVLKCGRQLSKSTSQAARGVVQANCIPYFSILYVTPLFEMIRRFSQNYVRPFIETSPVSKLFYGSKTINSVLQRSFKNHSQMMFTFAFLDAERTRGISADQMCVDEIQDMDIDFLPIMRETMSGSRFCGGGGIEVFTGTPKTLDNTIESLFQDSSQAEWLVPCPRCHYDNIPSLTHDLERMIGPLHDRIGPDRPATLCAKCRRPVDPRGGRWVHRYPERRWKFAGYHVPQIVMPMHYANYEKWDALLAKQQGKGNTPQNVFYNEVCGESYDTGARLITVTDLKKAGVLPWRNQMAEAKKHIGEYIARVLAVDWGGGGEDQVSFTTMACLGMLPNGKIHVIWGYRSLTPHEHVQEARLVLQAASELKCGLIVHDYNGAGSLRETLIVQAGYPFDRIMPIAYTRAASGNILVYKPPTEIHPRHYYMADKARSLVLTCNQVKNGWLQFFQYDYQNADDPGLLYDFLALVEEKTDSRTGREIYTIIRDPNRTDDFAQACNMGCLALWHTTDKWPNIAEVADIKIDARTQEAVHPIGEVDWTDL